MDVSCGTAGPDFDEVRARSVVSELSFIRLFVLIGSGEAMLDPRNSWGFEAGVGRRILGHDIAKRLEDRIGAQRARRAYP